LIVEKAEQVKSLFKSYSQALETVEKAQEDAQRVLHQIYSEHGTGPYRNSGGALMHIRCARGQKGQENPRLVVVERTDKIITV
jgi:hypothetical protein